MRGWLSADGLIFQFRVPRCQRKSNVAEAATAAEAGKEEMQDAVSPAAGYLWLIFL